MQSNGSQFKEFIERVSGDLRLGDEGTKAKFLDAFGEHLTIGTIIAGANLSEGGVPHVGPLFDPARLAEYGREFRSRISFSRLLPNFITGGSAQRRRVVRTAPAPSGAGQSKVMSFDGGISSAWARRQMFSRAMFRLPRSTPPR